MHDQEPSLPLSAEQFRHALHVGHGRARRQLTEFGIDSFREIVLDAAVSCQVDDPQVESLPAAWFIDFCEAAGIAPALLGTTPGKDNWDNAWRFALLGQLALRQRPGAREALYGALFETDSGELDSLLANLLPVADAHEQHAVVTGVLDLLDGSPSVRDRRLALYVYESSPCQNCRCSSVRTLLAWNECPQWVLAEGRCDASEEIRTLVTEHTATA